MPKRAETHKFYTVEALRAFISTLTEDKKSYQAARIGRPKANSPLYMVVVYG